MVGMEDIFDHGEGSFSGRFKIFFVLVNYFSRFTKVYFFGCRVHLQEWHLYSPYQKPWSILVLVCGLWPKCDFYRLFFRPGFLFIFSGFWLHLHEAHLVVFAVHPQISSSLPVLARHSRKYHTVVWSGISFGKSQKFHKRKFGPSPGVLAQDQIKPCHAWRTNSLVINISS